MGRGKTTRLLVAHRGLLSQRDEVADLCETVAGAVEAGLPGHVELEVTDLRYRYRATVQGGAFEPVPTGRLLPALLSGRYDIALIHEPVPLMHLLLAAVLRCRGTTVVHQPINMISRAYCMSAWFAPRSWLFRRVRPALVWLTTLGWKFIANGFLCVSAHEIEDSNLRPARCRVVRWPRPPTGLAAATYESAEGESRLGATGLGPDAPLAFVNRFDWHRKGFDRLCQWLEDYGHQLPRPAVLLLAPKPPDIPDRLQKLVDEGLIEWNTTATGRSLHRELMRCRALLLLSRYDGQSRVLREASLAGLPTISTVDSHFAEIVSALGCGFVIDGDDPAELQQAFSEVSEQVCSVAAARKLFDRAPIGAETIDALLSLHDDVGVVISIAEWSRA